MELQERRERAAGVWFGESGCKVWKVLRARGSQGGGEQVSWEQVLLHLEQSQGSDLFPECWCILLFFCSLWAGGGDVLRGDLIFFLGARSKCPRWAQNHPLTLGVVLGMGMACGHGTGTDTKMGSSSTAGGSFPCRAAPWIPEAREFPSFLPACWGQRGEGSAALSNFMWCGCSSSQEGRCKVGSLVPVFL